MNEGNVGSESIVKAMLRDRNSDQLRLFVKSSRDLESTSRCPSFDESEVKKGVGRLNDLSSNLMEGVGAGGIGCPLFVHF